VDEPLTAGKTATPRDQEDPSMRVAFNRFRAHWLTGLVLAAFGAAAPLSCGSSKESKLSPCESELSCGQLCSLIQPCPAGQNCGSDSKCTAECVSGDTRCTGGQICTSDGRCVDQNTSVGGAGGSGSGGSGGACATLQAQVNNVIPTVVLLV